MTKMIRIFTSRTSSNNSNNNNNMTTTLKKRCSSSDQSDDATMADTCSWDGDTPSPPPSPTIIKHPQQITQTTKTLCHQVSVDFIDDVSTTEETTTSQGQPQKGFFGGSPVIGIISQPRTNSETQDTEYVIAASYVKWVEASGGRVLVIPWDAPEEMARAVFSNINGLLLIGGNSVVPLVARVLWDMANKANAAGDFFPIWGTCLGFEYLLMLASGKDEFIMEGGYDSHNVCWPVDLVPEEPSELYANPIIQTIVKEQPVTMNNHEFGISPETFQRCPGLVNMFRITSTNLDFKGRAFVSTIESKDPSTYPYYGVQYHPEKNAFEYGTVPGSNTPYENINHSAEAVYFSFHLASFFVNLARKNLEKGKHIYKDMECFPLVYNYQVGTGLKFQQYFLVPPVGSTKNASDGSIRFVGKDYSWRLDDYLADHVGIYKTEYTDE